MTKRIARRKPQQKNLHCHFELSIESEKSTQIKRKLTIFGYFANAQYDNKKKSVWQEKSVIASKLKLECGNIR